MLFGFGLGFFCLKHGPGCRKAAPLGPGRGLHAVGRKGRTSVPAPNRGVDGCWDEGMVLLRRCSLLSDELRGHCCPQSTLAQP